MQVALQRGNFYSGDEYTKANSNVTLMGGALKSGEMKDSTAEMQKKAVADAKSQKWAKQKQFATQMNDMKHGTQRSVGFTGAGAKGLFENQMIGVDVG